MSNSYMSQRMTERRTELIAEISHRMKTQGNESLLRLCGALELDKQPTNALESWLIFLKRAKIEGREEQCTI